MNQERAVSRTVSTGSLPPWTSSTRSGHAGRTRPTSPSPSTGPRSRRSSSSRAGRRTTISPSRGASGSIGPETFDRLVAAGKPNEASKLGRAPTLVVASTKLTGDDYQNREDLFATACAVYIVLLAAHARGLASYWRTPALFETPEAREILGFEESEEFVALIHLGRPATSPPAKERKPVGAIARVPALDGYDRRAGARVWRNWQTRRV